MESKRFFYELKSARNEINLYIKNQNLKNFCLAYITFLIIRPPNNILNEYENIKIIQMVNLYGNLFIDEIFHIKFKNVKRISNFLFLYFAFYLKYVEPLNLNDIFSNLNLRNELIIVQNSNDSNLSENNSLGILYGMESYANSIIEIIENNLHKINFPILNNIQERKILLNS